MTRWREDRRARRGRAAARVFLVVAAGAAAVTWWQQPWAEVARDGEVVALDSASLPVTSQDEGGEQEVVVALPLGTLTLRTGPAPTELEATDLADEDRLADYDTELTAPRGSAFVPVLWDDVETGAPAGTGLEPDEQDAALRAAAPTLELVDDDGDVLAGPFDLLEPDAQDGGASRQLAVTTDDPEGLRARVVFDGEAQLVDLVTGDVDAGVAAPLYDPLEEPADVYRECEVTTEAPPAFAIDPALVVCTVTVTRTPWLADQGWVDEPGATWTVVEAIVTAPFEPSRQPTRAPQRFPDLDETWDVVRGGEATIALDGSAPDLEERGPQDTDAAEARWRSAVWLTGADEDPADVVLEMPVRLVPFYDQRPGYDASVTATVAVAAPGEGSPR